MRDLEHRVGIQPLDELLAERDALIVEAADLRARHGPFGTWDAIRKSHLAMIAMEVRATAERQGTKVTEACVSDLAHADPRYMELIAEATRDRARLAILDAKIEGIDARIQRANVVTRFAASELHLA